MSSPPPYYKPYLASDSESSDSDSSYDEQANFAKLARRLKEGFDDASSTSSGSSGFVPVPVATAAAPAAAPPTVTTASPPAPGKETSVTSKVDTVVMLRSRDRDKSIYPQPSACQLTLPRIYTNVSGFSIAQINLTSAFFYFSFIKSNVAIEIFEQDTVLYEPKLVPSQTNIANRLITSIIRDGSYNISQLLTELQTQLNRVPLFYDYLNGFSDFLQAFSVNGDYSVNFNYPGDFYYDALTQVFVPNPTRASIVSYYFQNQYANQFEYTQDQLHVAYYYPVIKEALLDPETVMTDYNFSGTGLSQADTINYLIHSFQGLDDKITITFINNNVIALDTYRLLHTFRYSLVNEYECSYNPTNNRVIIQCQTLNNSLVALLNAQYSSFLSQQLSLFGISPDVYNSLANTNTQLLSIIQAMYEYLQLYFAQDFAVNYGTYTRAYYGNTSNTVFIRYGLTAAGIYTKYTPGVTQQQIEIDIALGFRQNPPYYWPRMSNLPSTEGAQRNMGTTTQLYPQGSNFPYNLSLSNIDLTRNFIDIHGDVYTDLRRKAGDVLVNVDASKYTVFQFRSRYRQTLQIETLPRQTNWRYPAWNKANNVAYPLSNLFDVSYCYVTPTSTMIKHVTPFDISYNAIYGWSNLSNTSTNFGKTYVQSASYWSSFSEHINVANSNGRYYTFQTPLPVIHTSSVYTYPFNVTIESYNTPVFPSDFYAFFYQDIAAFSADISGVRHEASIHYKHVMDISANTFSSFTYSFNAYANQQYYILMRAKSITPSSTDYRIIPWFPSTIYSTLSYSTDFDPAQDPLTMLSNFNVAKQADPDFLRLPIQPSTLWYYEPPQELVNIPLSTNTVAIGYDNRGVSIDLTDYVPFSPYNTVSTIYPPATLSVDPITNYIFQHNSPYNDLAQSYFYSGSKNAILKPYAQAQYTPGTVKARQYKMVNYYATNYIKDPPNVSLQYNPLTSTSQYILPYNISTTSNTPIPGYKYSLQGNLVLGAGNCGFMFTPGEGTWAIDRITFKSNFVNPAASQNENVHALAVFITGEIFYQPTSYIQLSNALAICLRTSENFYQDSNSLNIGFDASLGTYHSYTNYPQLVSRISPISGLDQIEKIFITDQNAYYSVVAFTFQEDTYSNWDSNAISTLVGNYTATNTFPSTSVYTIQNMTGSPIAYPYANKAYPSTVFYDGQSAPTEQGVVLSTSNGNSSVYGPSQGYDESQSQYAQSIPFVNSHMHYLSPLYIVNDSNGFQPWTQIPIRPNYVYASVPNYMMFQATSFAITKYISYTTINRATPAARYFTYEEQLAPQQIFPDHENTILIGTSGNTQEYVFLGAATIPGNSNVSQLRFKVYDPVKGIMSELPTNPSYTFSNSFLLQNFVFHTDRQWYISATNQVKNIVYLQGDSSYNEVGNTKFSYTYSNNSVSELQMDPNGAFLYFARHNGQGFSTMQMFSLDSNDPQFVRNNSNGYKINLEIGGVLPNTYRTISVMLNSRIGSEEVLLTNTAFSYSNYYYLDFYNPLSNSTSNAFINPCAQHLTQGPFKIIGGANGSKWNLSEKTPFIYGNRNDAYDAPISLSIAWQIFFPTIKIEMRQLTTGVSPIIDLTNLTYPEWPHTAMFAYSNYNTLVNDISGHVGSNQGKWGQENNYNFFASDISFNGFYFNSYMMSVPLVPNFTNGSYLTDYYVAIRGWLPTEQFQTMARFYLPNEYSFGFVRFLDLSNEVQLAATIPTEFNPQYLETLRVFNSNFVFTGKNFGSNGTQGLTGSNLNSSNFGDFMNQYQEFYSTFSTNSYLLSNIQATVNTSINQFIITDMQYILPSTAVTRQRFTDPLLFQINWYSQLGFTFKTLDDEWGLGWNLGFPKVDTGFATIQTGSSFYKITNDYIYLRLNPEFNMNRVDAGGKENYKVTREPTGITNEYYCKLLLTNFGGNATTFIHNPITFSPQLNRLTKLEFQWIDANGTAITNNDCEWDMVVSIGESVNMVPAPSLSVTLPQALPFNPTLTPGQSLTTPPAQTATGV